MYLKVTLYSNFSWIPSTSAKFERLAFVLLTEIELVVGAVLVDDVFVNKFLVVLKSLLPFLILQLFELYSNKEL